MLHRPDAPALRRIETEDGGLAYYEWPGDPSAPLAVFLHATGFHGRVWDQTIRALPPGYRALALDLPGHGQSGRRGPIAAWADSVAPVVAALDGLAIEGALAIGHSMGGYLAAMAALERPAAFRGLMLIDPVMPAPEDYASLEFKGMAGPHEHPVARRRDRWPDWRAFHDRFKDRTPYSLWRPGILEDYCRHGLTPAPDGDGYVLACAPIFEASVYFNSRRANVLDKLAGVEAPVTILRAHYTPRDPALPTDFMRSTTWAGLADCFQAGEDVYLAERTHFIPMEDPEEVARRIVALAGKAGRNNCRAR